MLFGLCRRREERGAAVRRARRCGSLDREGVWTRASTRTRVPLGAAGPATAYSYTGRAERQLYINASWGVALTNTIE